MMVLKTLVLPAALFTAGCADNSEDPVDPATAERAVDTGPVQIAWLPERVARWVPEIERAAHRHGVDPDLVAIVVLVESGGDPIARSPVGARGLMQLMPATARGDADRRGEAEFDTERLDEPTYNLDAGAYHLSHLIATLGDGALDDATVELVAAAYNGGLDRALGWVSGKPLSRETTLYKARVLSLWRARARKQRPAP